MYSATQLHYLQAMGIPAWQSRKREALAQPQAPGSGDEAKGEVEDLAGWLSSQSMQVSAPGQAALWGSGESGLLVLSECLPANDLATPVTQPFYGPQGKMLDAMLKGINLGRRSCQIAALCHPETASSSGLKLARFLEQLKPRLVLFFCFPGGCGGRVEFDNQALKGLLQTGPCPCIVTYHPLYLLDHPECKRDTWEDLKRVRQLLGAT